jgi:hypothetical protein
MRDMAVTFNLEGRPGLHRFRRLVLCTAGFSFQAVPLAFPAAESFGDRVLGLSALDS